MFASGIDALFDAVLSFATLIGIIVTLVFHISIDGILGGLIAFLLLRLRFKFFEASNDIIGKTADRDLIRKLKKQICTFPEVEWRLRSYAS